MNLVFFTAPLPLNRYYTPTIPVGWLGNSKEQTRESFTEKVISFLNASIRSFVRFDKSTPNPDRSA
jgi:hypothetical protein